MLVPTAQIVSNTERSPSFLDVCFMVTSLASSFEGFEIAEFTKCTNARRAVRTTP